MNGKMIYRTKEYKYLGIYIDESFKYTKHISYITDKGLTIVNRLITLASRSYRVNKSTILTYHNGLLLAIFQYAASIWGYRLLENCKLR